MRPRAFHAVLLAGLALAVGPIPPVLGEDWPQFRGPSRTGSSPETGIFDPDGFGLDLV